MNSKNTVALVKSQLNNFAVNSSVVAIKKVNDQQASFSMAAAASQPMVVPSSMPFSMNNNNAAGSKIGFSKQFVECMCFLICLKQILDFNIRAHHTL